MAFVNFQRYVCDNCGFSTTQAGAANWFELRRQEKGVQCYMVYSVDACSMDCLARVAATPINMFKHLRRESEIKANS